MTSDNSTALPSAQDYSDRLAARGLPTDALSARLRQSLDIAAGRKKLYRQEPTAFALTGLPDVQFFDPDQFEWAAAIEAATPKIRDELQAILDGGDQPFNAYIHSASNAEQLGDNQRLVDNVDWSVLSLCHNGWLAPDLVKRCPQTWAAALSAPLPRIAGWGPTVLFSMLRAGARIAAHNGMFNSRLICHLPLIVPPGCGFRVGNEVREWQEGKLLIFDDTIEHEAWNDSDKDRIILIFDIWRPELSERERRELTAMFSD